MSPIDPIAIALIATAASPESVPPGIWSLRRQQERRFRESLREYPPHTVLDTPFCGAFHREYYLHDPYLDVAFVDAGGWSNGRFLHQPLISARTAEDMMSQNPWYYWEDWLVLREDERLVARRIRPSPALLHAIRRVLDEP